MGITFFFWVNHKHNFMFTVYMLKETKNAFFTRKKKKINVDANKKIRLKFSSNAHKSSLIK